MDISEIREIRNRMLFDSDWTQLPDCSLSNVKKEEWTNYRQALRDITNNIQESDFHTDKFGNKYFMSWPTKPSNN